MGTAGCRRSSTRTLLPISAALMLAVVSRCAAFSVTTGKLPAQGSAVLARAASRSWTSRAPCRAWTMAEGGRASAAVVQDQKAAGKTGGVEKLDLQPPKGTRDFYPDDMRQRNWLFGHWKEVARVFGFEEYDAPVLENENLYVRKAGEEVTQQLYNFEDKGERRVALRPEMTPSLARMVMAKGKSLSLPVKWFSLPQCWRYERMTRGRRREHFQWNMDIWGVEGIEAEAELLAAITTFFSRVGISSDDVGIKVNSRAVLAEVLTTLGVPDDKFAATCVLLDKLEKVPVAAVKGDMEALGLTEDMIQKLLDTMAMTDLDALEAVLGGQSPALCQIKQLFAHAEAYGYKDWLVFDASVVRGLAYYTGLVFEGFDRKGTLRAICGGGRYDKLLETFGGTAVPAVGFGFGDAVIVELLKDKGVLPSFTNAHVDAVVYPFSRAQFGGAAAVAATLRSADVSVDLVLEEKKTKWLWKQADRVSAQFVVLLGEDEAAKGVVNVKNLATGKQSEVPVADVAAYIQSESAAQEP